MKKCVTCLQVKDESEFSWRYKDRGIRHPTCKECHKRYRKNWYENHKEIHLQNVQVRKVEARQKAREYVFDYLSTHPCSQCGEPDPVVLEFHHLSGKDKEISVMITDGYPVQTIQAEIDRCIVLCANCHRKLTAQEGGWFRSCV